MNILHRYLLREIGITFLGVTALLLLIFVSRTLVKILVKRDPASSRMRV